LALSSNKINNILNQEIFLDELSNEELSDFCILANEHYRNGSPIISDQDYDFIFFKELKKRLPDHYLVKEIEPESKTGFSDEKNLLPEPMLSIDKAYSFNEILKWIERITKSCVEIEFDLNLLNFIASPKLDGFAGYDDGNKLYTRGDGKKGSNITRAFERGLKIFNHSERGQGPGEIVVKKKLFRKASIKIL